MDLNDRVYKKIRRLSDRGNECMERGEWAEAISAFSSALELIPDPKSDWQAATWLYGSIGDAYFMDRSYFNAQESFLDSYNCPGGATNAFIVLRLGEIFLEIGEHAKATDYLLRAYMLEGEEIFAGENPRYLTFLKSRIKLED